MRVTNNMLSGNIVSNINETAEKFFRLNNIISSGKKLSKPSDNPVDAAKSLSLRAGLRQIEQYKRNLDASQTWLDDTEAVMRQSISILQQIRDLTLQMINDTNGPQDKATIMKTIDELHQQLKTSANHNLTGRYIFAGSQTLTQPFDLDLANWFYSGDSQLLDREISPSNTMSVNITGDRVFALDSTQGYGAWLGDTWNSIFYVLSQLSTDPNPTGFYIEKIDMALDNIFDKLGEVGAKSARIEMLQDQHENTSINLTKYLSNNEDADFAKTVMDLKGQETIYEATLASSARIMQVSLLDFLR